MIFQLQANVPMLIAHYDGAVTVYVRQYGAGNLRLGNTREDLLYGTNLAPGQVVDGVPQAAADGKQQYFWSGDLWVISDVAGPVMIEAPAYTTYVDRSTGRRTLPSDVTIESEFVDDLSTYQYDN